jgi:hypothetical protein
MVVNMASLPSTVTVVTGAGCVLGAAGRCWPLARSGKKSDPNAAHTKIAGMERIFFIRLFAKSAFDPSRWLTDLDLSGNNAQKRSQESELNRISIYKRLTFESRNRRIDDKVATLASGPRICLK